METLFEIVARIRCRLAAEETGVSKSALDRIMRGETDVRGPILDAFEARYGKAFDRERTLVEWDRRATALRASTDAAA